MDEQKKVETKDDNQFKNIIDNDNLIEVRSTLSKLKIILENKAEDKLKEIIQLKQDLPHLIHLRRIMKMEENKNNE